MADFEEGSFQSVLDDHVDDASLVTRVVLATGKVAHEALAKRDDAAATSVAVVRVEQLYPWPRRRRRSAHSLQRISKRSCGCKRSPRTWVRGPIVHRQFHDQFRDQSVRHVARAESASPATGSSLVHTAEQADLLVRAVLVSPMKGQRLRVVVDGSNFATEGRVIPSLAQLDEAVRAFLEEHPGAEMIVVADASFEHRVATNERAHFKEAELAGEIVTPPAGAVAGATPSS